MMPYDVEGIIHLALGAGGTRRPPVMMWRGELLLLSISRVCPYGPRQDDDDVPSGQLIWFGFE